MGDAAPVYVWLTDVEAERGLLPERVDAAQLHTDLQGAQQARHRAPGNAFYLVRADAGSRRISGYA